MALAIGIFVLRIALQLAIVLTGPGDTFWWFVRHASRDARALSEITVCTTTGAGRNRPKLSAPTGCRDRWRALQAAR